MTNESKPVTAVDNLVRLLAPQEGRPRRFSQLYERIDDLLIDEADNAWTTRGRVFAEAMGIPVRDFPARIPISEMELALKVMFEEVTELIHACGFRLICHDSIELEHVEGQTQDLVKIADGGADTIVTVIQLLGRCGIHAGYAYKEAWASNMSKLDDSGNPIVNTCVSKDPEHDCSANDSIDCVPLDPRNPIGKRLKGPNFFEPNFAVACGINPIPQN